MKRRPIGKQIIITYWERKKWQPIVIDFVGWSERILNDCYKWTKGVTNSVELLLVDESCYIIEKLSLLHDNGRYKTNRHKYLAIVDKLNNYLLHWFFVMLKLLSCDSLCSVNEILISYMIFIYWNVVKCQYWNVVNVKGYWSIFWLWDGTRLITRYLTYNYSN